MQEDDNEPQVQVDNQLQQQVAQLNQQLQDAIAQIAQLQAQAQAQVQPAQVQPAQQAPVQVQTQAQAQQVANIGAQNVQFAYSPAATNANALIDYRTTAGMKLYKQATEGLAFKHDLDAEHLNRFLESLRSRSIEQAWDGNILQITQAGVQMSIIENYGSITQQAVTSHAHAYAFQQQRVSQDSNNLFKCLESSLTEDALNTLYAEKEISTIRRGDVPTAPPGGNNEEKFRDGVLFLWSIINHTTAKTHATISVIIEQLTNLPSAMSEFNSDVNAFNTQVRNLVNSYYANKREAYDNEVLLQSLFKAYKQVSDREFVEYIKRKEQDHEKIRLKRKR